MRKNKDIQQKNKGAILVEVFLSVTILVILTTGSLSLLFPGLKEAEIGRQRLQAKWLLWEQEEAIRQVRSESWVNLAPGTYYAQYYPTSNPPSQYQGWQLIPGIGTKNGFQESLTISVPYRTDVNTLSDSSGSLDYNMRKVVGQVSWTSFGQNYTQTLTTYISDWQPF